MNLDGNLVGPADWPSSQAGQSVRCSWVPDDRVPAGHRKMVRRHVQRAAKRMRLGHIRVRYFGPPVDGGDFAGIAPGPDMLPGGVTPGGQSDTIGLNAGIRGPAVVGVIAHELGHIAQRRAATIGDLERDADRRAIDYLRGR